MPWGPLHRVSLVFLRATCTGFFPQIQFIYWVPETWIIPVSLKQMESHFYKHSKWKWLFRYFLDLVYTLMYLFVNTNPWYSSKQLPEILGLLKITWPGPRHLPSPTPRPLFLGECQQFCRIHSDNCSGVNI